MKLAINRVIVVILGVISAAALAGALVLLLSPLPAPYPTGGWYNCGEPGAILLPEEDAGTHGDIAEYDEWQNTCAVAMAVGAGVVVGLGLLAVGAACGATAVHGQQWRARLPWAGAATSNRL